MDHERMSPETRIAQKSRPSDIVKHNVSVKDLVKFHEERISMECGKASVNLYPSNFNVSNKNSLPLKIIFNSSKQEDKQSLFNKIVEHFEKISLDLQDSHCKVLQSYTDSPTYQFEIIYEEELPPHLRATTSIALEGNEPKTSLLFDEFEIIYKEELPPHLRPTTSIGPEGNEPKTSLLSDEIEIIHAADNTPLSIGEPGFLERLQQVFRRQPSSRRTILLIDETPAVAEEFFNPEIVYAENTTPISNGEPGFLERLQQVFRRQPSSRRTVYSRESETSASTSLGKQIIFWSEENATQDLADAVILNNSTAAELAIYRGADLNKRDRLNRTVLHIASLNGFLEVVKLLLNNSDDKALEAESITGDRPLHLAAAFGKLAVVELLLKAGAQVMARNSEEWTPLHYAASNGHLSVAQVLVQHKSSIHAKTAGNMTPLQLARKHKQELLEEFLESISEK